MAFGRNRQLFRRGSQSLLRRNRGAIYNIMGEEIAMLVNQLQDSGQHSVVWKGKDSSEGLVNPGVYVYKIQINGQVQNNKMLLFHPPGLYYRTTLPAK